MPFKYNDPEQSVNDLVFIENFLEEILQSKIDFDNLSKKNSQYLRSNLQKKFDILHKTAFETHFNNRDVSLIKNIEGLKITRWMRSNRGTMCDSYLRNNL